MSLFKVSTVETIAVLVDAESDAYRAGIRNGTVILSWDSVPVDKAAAAVLEHPYADRYPIRENAEFLSAVYLAGQGGDTVNVTFQDASGTEQTAVLGKIGSYTDRLCLALDCIGHDWIRDRNFSTKMITDTCGYLRIDAEEYHLIPEYLSYTRGGYYPQLMDELNEKFTALKEQGAVLVNSGCLSAGDGAVLFLSGCSNVTLMGMTPSCGVNQNNGGEIWLPDGFKLKYPAALTLDEDAKPMIDTDASRENRIPLDVVIPGRTILLCIGDYFKSACFYSGL